MQTRPFFRQGIFHSQKATWIGLGVYTILLHSTLTLTYDLYIDVFRELGKRTVSHGIYSIATLCGLALLVFVLLRLLENPGTYATMVARCWPLSSFGLPSERKTTPGENGAAERPVAGNCVTSNPGKIRPETHLILCQKNAATAHSCPGNRLTSRPILVVRRSADRALETSSPVDIFPALARPIRPAR